MDDVNVRVLQSAILGTQDLSEGPIQQDCCCYINSVYPLDGGVSGKLSRNLPSASLNDSSVVVSFPDFERRFQRQAALIPKELWYCEATEL